MKRIFLFLLLISFFSVSFAEEKKTLEFEVYFPYVNENAKQKSWMSTLEASETSSFSVGMTEPIDVDQLSKEIALLSLMCEAIGDGQVRAWLQAKIGGGLIVSASGEGGLEVTVNCG